MFKNPEISISFQMITRMWTFLLLVSTLYHVIAGLQDLTTYKQKFEYKHSFKGPNLVNVNGDIPFWQYGGSECIYIYLYLTKQSSDCRSFVRTKLR